MGKYYKEMLEVFWKDFKSATGEQVIGALLAIGIFLFQLWYGLIKTGDVRPNFWAIAWPYVALVVCLLFWHLIRAPWKLHQQNIQAHETTKGLKLKAEMQLRELLYTKPKIEYQFSYEGQQAAMSVKNNGAIAEVWASLRIQGMVRSGAGPFARWAHSSSFKTKIAKGETHDLLLAGLRIQNGSISTWVVFFATEANVGMTEALQSSLVQTRDDGQADDIDLYIKLFSDPACVELPKEWHVILHSHAAELGD